ncbi:MAG: hypothetical protein ACM3NP_07625 [Actinomycetota bacterium]
MEQNGFITLVVIIFILFLVYIIIRNRSASMKKRMDARSRFRRYNK